MQLDHDLTLADWLELEIEWGPEKPSKSGKTWKRDAMGGVLPDEFWSLWAEEREAIRALGVRLGTDEDGKTMLVWVRGGGTRPKGRPNAGLAPAPTTPPPRTTLPAPADWRASFLERFPKFRPNQVDAVHTLVSAIMDGQRSTLDASDPGEGKTWIALALPALFGDSFGVVCPANVVTKWEQTARETFGLTPAFVISYDKLRSGRHGLVTRHGTVKRPKFSWLLPNNTMIIYDEVHGCGDPSTLNSKALAAAVKAGFPVHMISATVADSPLDLGAVGHALGLHDGNGFWHWCLKNGCRPGPFGGLVFNMGDRGKVNPTPNQIKARQSLEKIHKTIFPGMGCRLRIRDHADSLPPNHIMVDLLDVSQQLPKHLEAWLASKEAEDEARAEEKGRPVMGMTWGTRDRQRAELSKVPSMVARAVDLIKAGNQVAVFLNFRKSIDYFIGCIPNGGPDYGVIAGHVSQIARALFIQRFQAGKTPLAICQTEAGGQSIDLDDQVGDAPRCTLISPGYKSKQLYQALGRAFRPASTKSPVRQWIIYVAGTIEEDVARVVQRKLDSQSIINDGDLSPVRVFRKAA